VDISKHVDTKVLIGIALASVFMTMKSRLWRYLLLGGLVAAYFVVKDREGEASKKVQAGITDFVERVPGIGGMLSRQMVK